MPPDESAFVARTMQALELLAFQPLSAPQVAVALQIHPRTARRMLTRLRDEGYLTLSGDARRLYSPTMRVVSLGAQIASRSPLTRASAEYVARLHERTGAAAHLAVPSYQSVLCVVHRDAGDEAVRIRPREFLPPHGTAVGKALLAWRDRWRESVLSQPLERHTPRTQDDVAALRAEAAATRERGYAIERGEFVENVNGVAVPVFLRAEAVAALGVSGAAIDTGAVAEIVVALASELSETLLTDDDG